MLLKRIARVADFICLAVGFQPMAPPALATPSVGNRRLLVRNLLRRFGLRLAKSDIQKSIHRGFGFKLRIALVLLTGVIGLSTASPTVAAPSSDIGGCPLFPADNIWNARVDQLPVDARSSDYINSIGANTGLHPDFGTNYQNAPIGIPYTTVLGTQPLVSITFRYDDQSDPGPYPIPPNPPIEGGPNAPGDRHILLVDTSACKLYEIFNGYPPNASTQRWCVSHVWCAQSGAVWDLRSNALRPATWTSADAAGLPILPGLVRYDEVAGGRIDHAIRFTVDISQQAYVWPARHQASNDTSPNRPPMGQRFRLKATKDISAFPQQMQVIFQAFKDYGIIVADNGSDWFISGAHDLRWDDDVLVSNFAALKGSDFEAVDVSSLMLNSDSGQVRTTSPFVPSHFQYLPIALR